MVGTTNMQNKKIEDLDLFGPVAAVTGAHLKADHRMDRCHLKGSEGDALHAVLCAAGYNIRWLLRMIAKKGLGLLLCLLQASGLAGLIEKLAEIFGLNRLQNSNQRWVLA